LVRVVTDNRNRATAAVRHLLSKHGGSMASAGSVAWQFERRGVVVVEDLPEDIDRDDLLMSLIDAGAIDLDDQGETIEITCEPTDLPDLGAAVRERGLVPIRAEVTMIPKSTVHVEEKSAEQVLKLIDALDENEDVQEVFANFDVDDEVLERLSG
jgi:transcriptional/translational regulatory protein YebC/TACO1